MGNWQCIQGCGACCHLDPSDRPDLADYLTPDELTHYLSLVGEDGWCIHYDHPTRQCTIYDTRPTFCRVESQTFEAMFGIDPDDLDDFAIECCQQQIEGVYGRRSEELAKFNAIVQEENAESHSRED